MAPPRTVDTNASLYRNLLKSGDIYLLLPVLMAFAALNHCGKNPAIRIELETRSRTPSIQLARTREYGRRARPSVFLRLGLPVRTSYQRYGRQDMIDCHLLVGSHWSRIDEGVGDELAAIDCA
jgi:hypothetical protein